MKTTSKNNTRANSARRRVREKELRRESILRAAETLFAQKGYRKTRIEDVAAAAAVSVGTVYGYFKNKEALLIQVLDDIGIFIRKIAANAFRGADSTLDGIERAGMAFFEKFCLPHPEKVLLLYDESIDFSAEFLNARRNFMLKMTADVNHALNTATDKLGIKYASDISAELMAVSTTAIFVWLGLYYRLWDKNPDQIIALGRETVAYVVGGIKSLIVSGG